MAPPSRAITLAGGGPAAGLHIGVLQRLEEEGIEFDVWALSCIGAWVGIVYQQFDPPHRGRQTYEFFRDQVFRDDEGYDRFPINKAFGPDLNGYMKALVRFAADPDSYRNLFLPGQMLDAAMASLPFLANPEAWMREGDRNNWWLNQVLAVHPLSRFIVSLMYLSEVNGLTRIWYPDSSFLEAIRIDKLEREAMPDIYHNAWNLSTQSMQLFHNHRRDDKYKPMTRESLCACSALPYIEQTVRIDGHVYCEGALVDTVNFKDLIDDYPELDEVWVSRIVDTSQVRVPDNIADGLANLCMLFAAEVGSNDVKLFRQHVRKRRSRKPRVVEIPVKPAIDFRWNRSNLDKGVEAGRHAVDELLKRYGPASKARAARLAA
jgi:predicted acylesterase/phospholipase RssA